MDVLFHADDFGISPSQSRKILDCHENGILNSLSVIVTSPRFEECAAMLDGAADDLRIGLHVNVVEGRCLADPSRVPLLVDSDGMFRLGFAEMLRISRGAGGEELRRQLTIEVAEQIERFVGRFPGLRDHLRIDGHQHFQLIPAELSAILDAVGETGTILEYLRVPVEPISPFLAPSVFWTIKPINWVKHWVLSSLWREDRSSLPEYGRVSATFCGVLFSGSMDVRRVREVFPRYLDLARERGMSLEFLFHPGRVDSPSECLNPALKGFVDFSTGEGRDVEARALHDLSLVGSGDDLRLVVASSSNVGGA